MANVKSKEVEKSFELFYKAQLGKILIANGAEIAPELGVEGINLAVGLFTEYHFIALKKLFPQIKDISLDRINNRFE